MHGFVFATVSTAGNAVGFIVALLFVAALALFVRTRVRTKLAVSEAADAAAAAALLASLPKDIPANTAAPTRTRARASSPKKVAVPVLDEDIALFIKD